MSERILSEAQVTLKGKLGLQRFFKGKEFELARPILYESLDQIAARLAIHSASGRAPTEFLKQFATYAVSRNRFIESWLRKKNSNAKLFESDEDWQQIVWPLMGAAVVERWMSDGHGADVVEDAEAITAEALRIELVELLQLAGAAGELTEKESQQLAEDVWYSENRPDMGDWIAAQLRRLIDDDADLLLLNELIDDDGEPIPRGERDREVAKKALLHLKVSALKDIGGEAAPGGSNNREVLVNYIVDRYGADEETIAELIWSKVGKGDLDGPTLVTRIMSLESPPDVERAANALAALRGRYLRVDVARWFLFGDLAIAEDGSLRLQGIVRYYEAESKAEYGEFTLATTLNRGRVELRLHPERAWLEMRAARANDVRHIARALERTAGIKTRPALHFSSPPLDGALLLINPRTRQFLDFIQTGFSGAGTEIRNMTTANFESLADVEGGSNRPRVRAVRLEGNQLTSHPQACQLMVTSRVLRSIDVLVRVGLTGGSEDIPVRFELAPGHAAVSTALSSLSMSDTQSVHANLTRRLESSIDSGVRDLEALKATVAKMEQRAQERTPDEADILITTNPEPSASVAAAAPNAGP